MHAACVCRIFSGREGATVFRVPAPGDREVPFFFRTCRKKRKGRGGLGLTATEIEKCCWFHTHGHVGTTPERAGHLLEDHALV
jgi:hypothetical protein